MTPRNLPANGFSVFFIRAAHGTEKNNYETFSAPDFLLASWV